MFLFLDFSPTSLRAVKEARLREIRTEILNSKRLQVSKVFGDCVEWCISVIGASLQLVGFLARGGSRRDLMHFLMVPINLQISLLRTPACMHLVCAILTDYVYYCHLSDPL